VTDRRLVVPLVAALGLVLTASGDLAAAVAAGEAPTVWIDRPLPGARVPFGPAPVTVHTAGAAVTVRFLVDGVATGTVAAPPGDLVTVSWSWMPTRGGQHLLTVVADGAAGAASDPVSVGVTFGEPPHPSPTPTASPSPSPTARTPEPTLSHTATPKPTQPSSCTPPLPDALNPPDFFLARASSDPPTNPPTFTWAYRTPPSCAPAGFRVTIVDSPSSGYRVTSGTLAAAARSWTPTTALATGASCVTYKWTFVVLRPDRSVGQRVRRSLAACS
jgi:hypothetical protein